MSFKFDKAKSLDIADSILGMEFKRGARGPEAIDCYGVVKYYYAQFGFTLPDYSYVENWDDKEEIYLAEYARFFRKLGPGETPEVGDMVLFVNTKEVANHAGIYLGDNNFVHAYEQIGTKIDSFIKRFPVNWKQKIYGYFRIRE